MWYHLKGRRLVSDERTRRDEGGDDEPEGGAKSDDGEEREVHNAPGFGHDEGVDWMQPSLVPEEDEEEAEPDQDWSERFRLSPV